MLRITVELVPYGDEDLAHNLGSIEIANDGSGDSRVGNYVVELTDLTATRRGEIYHVRAEVHDYPRDKGYWNLLSEALWALKEGTIFE